uniref:Uncharacterized protein n=1 Tax=Anguilla anguilla TaxID=7936 RepID=A0A0E9VIS5_ANGAN
MFGTVWRADSF